MAEQTIEELQAQIVELQGLKESQAQELESIKKKTSEMEENLTKARELNASLLLRVSSNLPDGDVKEQPDDTVESLCEEIVKSVDEKYMKRF